MNSKIQRLLSRVQGDDKEKSEVNIRKSYPIFCASATDGIVIAALNPPGMPMRIDIILDRIAYGGIGQDADIDAIVQEVGASAIWKAEVEATPEDVSADHLAQDARGLIAGGRKGSLLSDVLEAELVFSELGFQQDEDRIVSVDVRGNQYRRAGWAILPDYLPKASEQWAESFAYDAELTMRQVLEKFEKLGKVWRSLRLKSKLELMWEVAFLRRDMAQQKRWYEVFERQSPKMLRGKSQ